jgi:pyruvate-formate lyase-activating enzyme
MPVQIKETHFVGKEEFQKRVGNAAAAESNNTDLFPNHVTKRRADILKIIHTTPWLADAVYFGMRHLNRWKRARNASVQATKIDQPFSPDYTLCISATNACNAACNFCAYPKTLGAKGIMPMDLFQQVLMHWKGLGGKRIDFTVSVGEPMLDPLLFDKIRVAKAAGIFSSFTTNGTMLTKNSNALRLVNSGVSHVYVSLDVPETYKQSFGIDQGDNVARGVEMLLSANYDLQHPVEIMLRFRSPLKPSQIIRSRFFQEKIRPRLNTRVRAYFTDEYDNWGGLIAKTDMIGAMKFAPPVPKPRVPCRRLFEPAVEWDGGIRLCACRTTTATKDLLVGNVRTMSLADAVGSDEGRRIVDSFFAGNPPQTCLNCTMYQPIESKHN